MAVQVVSNNVPNPAERAAVEQAVVDAIGLPNGAWRVRIEALTDPPSWRITVGGPNNFDWTDDFLRVEKRNSLDDYVRIRQTISRIFPHVYLSYALLDNATGIVDEFSKRLSAELQIQSGRPVSVAYRGLSQHGVDTANRSTFLVPLVSPSYFKSEECLEEFELFLEREKQTGRRLIFPVYFVRTEELENRVPENAHPWVQRLRGRQMMDFRNHRLDLTSPAAFQTIGFLAKSISDTYDILRSEPQTGSLVPSGPAEPVYLESLRLTNFRCFEELPLRFDRESKLEGRWTCIAGINGAGKSTILQALGLALLGNPLAVELGGERLNRMRRFVDLMNQQPTSRLEITLRTPEPRPLWLEIGAGRVNSGPSWDPIRRLVVAGYGATRNLSERSEYRNDNLSPDVRRLITLFDPLSQLAGAETLLGKQPPIPGFFAVFRNLIDQVFGAELQIAHTYPGVRFMVSNTDFADAIDLPDGFRSAIAWLADLCSIWCEKAPNLAANGNPADIHAIVLIDEIDLHLHPSLQRSLVPRLRKALPKVQWIVTTHSPLVLANFDANEIIALDRDRDGNIRELDRQILGFTTDEIYEWLMGTRPMGAAFESEIERSDQGLGKSGDEIARLMRVSPTSNGEDAKGQVEEFKAILKSLGP